MTTTGNNAIVEDTDFDDMPPSQAEYRNWVLAEIAKDDPEYVRRIIRRDELHETILEQRVSCDSGVGYDGDDNLRRLCNEYWYVATEAYKALLLSERAIREWQAAGCPRQV